MASRGTSFSAAILKPIKQTPLTADHLCSANIHHHGCYYARNAHSQTTAQRSSIVPVVTTIESSFLLALRSLRSVVF
jgi:hypothetical protein